MSTAECREFRNGFSGLPGGGRGLAALGSHPSLAADGSDSQDSSSLPWPLTG